MNSICIKCCPKRGCSSWDSNIRLVSPPQSVCPHLDRKGTAAITHPPHSPPIQTTSAPAKSATDATSPSPAPRLLTEEVEDAEGRQHQLDGRQADKGDAECADVGLTRREAQLHPHLRIHVKIVNPHGDNRIHAPFHEVQHQEALGATCVAQTNMVPGGREKKQTRKTLSSFLRSGLWSHPAAELAHDRVGVSL